MVFTTFERFRGKRSAIQQWPRPVRVAATFVLVLISRGGVLGPSAAVLHVCLRRAAGSRWRAVRGRGASLGSGADGLDASAAARRPEVHAEALRRLAEARENDYRRYLLLDCLEAYATLDEEQAQELGALLRTERYQGAQAMAMTTFEKGLQQGQRTTVRKLLEARFGQLSPSVQERFESLSPERLEALAVALLKAQSLQELGAGGLSPGAAPSRPLRRTPSELGLVLAMASFRLPHHGDLVLRGENLGLTHLDWHKGANKMGRNRFRVSALHAFVPPFLPRSPGFRQDLGLSPFPRMILPERSC